jgi:uncharacterized protein
MILSRYSSIFELDEFKGQKVIYNLLNHSIGLIRTASLNELERGSSKSIPKDDSKTLRDMDVLVENEEDDSEKALYYTRKIPFTSRAGYLTLLTCLDCNLNCYYCSQKGIIDGKVMDTTTAKSVGHWIQNWIQTNQLQHLTLSVIGGEPLLHLEPLDEILPMIKETGITCRFMMISNGVLLDEKMVESLVSKGFERVQVTLDGDEEAHDKVKRYQGKGTFQRILQAINLCTEHGLEVDIRINYPRSNKEQARNTIRAIATLKNRAQIQVYFAVLQSNNFFCTNELATVDPELYEYAFYTGFSIPGPFGALLCQAESDYGFTIDPDGKVFKCYNSVGRYGEQLGAIKEGLLSVENHALLNNHPVYECLKCKYFPICRGGCKFLRRARHLAPATKLCALENYKVAEKKILPFYVQSLLRKALK